MNNLSNPNFDLQKVRDAESKIKSSVLTDKKIFQMLKNKNVDEDSNRNYDEYDNSNDNYTNLQNTNNRGSQINRSIASSNRNYDETNRNSN
jgi:hypothetical protein